MTISGGLVIAAGSSGMAQGFDASSEQASLSYTYSSIQSAGTLITLTDASGNVVVSYTPEKDYQNVIISAPELAEGQSYTLYSGGSVANGVLSGGTQVESITLSGVSTTVGSGGAGSGQMPSGGQAPSGGAGGGQMPGGGTNGGPRG